MDHWLSTVFVDLVTPFHHGAIDGAALASLVRWQAGRGMRGFVVNGAVGEYATLSQDERRAVVAIVRANAGRFAHLLLSAGSNDTAATIAEIEYADRLGVDGILLRMPYYSRPTQAGLVAHATEAAAASPLPIVLDDDPDRCGVTLSGSSLEALTSCETIVGVLDRRGDARRCETLGRSMPDRYLHLTGRIDSLAAYRLCGGSGAVSSAAGLFPSLCMRMAEALRRDDYPAAQLLQRRTYPLLAILGEQPAQLKLAYALQRPGALSLECREVAEHFDADRTALLHEALGALPKESGTIFHAATVPTHQTDPLLFRNAERQAALQARI